MLVNGMKLLPLVLLLILAACASTPQEEIASGYARLAATEQAQVQAEQTQAEQSRQATEAAMMTAEAAQSEIDQMNAEAQATLAALESQEQAIELAALVSRKTQMAWTVGLSATQTLQSVQATQTDYPLQATAAYAEQRSAVKRADALATAIPAILAVIAGLVMISGVWLIVWMAGNVTVDLVGRFVKNVTIPKRQTAALETENGTMKFDPNATIHSRDTEKLTDFNQLDSQAQSSPRATATTHDNDLVLSDDVKSAIYLLQSSIARKNDDDEDNLVLSHNRLGYGASRWQNVVDWMKNNRLVYTNSTGTYLMDGTCAHVITELKAGRLPQPTG